MSKGKKLIIHHSISGLKCDNPLCDYNNTDIQSDDYDIYLNSECPKCESNLLTQKDLDTVKLMHKIINFINLFSPVFGSYKKDFTDKGLAFKVAMDGSGKVDIKQEEGK